MSSTIQDIAKALEIAATSVLTPIVGAQNIAYPNVAYQPTLGTPYAKLDHLWSPGAAASVGVGAQTRRPGVTQVMLFFPVGDGSGGQLAAVDALLDGFPYGTRLTHGAITVSITSTNPAPVIDGQDGWIAVPVSINWLVYS